MIQINLYTKPACVQCDATKTKLDKLGLAYTPIDVTEDDAAMQHVKDLGFSQVPVVEVVGAEIEPWSGYSPDKLVALAQLALPFVTPGTTPLVGS